MSKITDKNTDKNWTDLLPPALVKDWQQFLRSRMYIAFFLLLQLVGWYFFIRTACDDHASSFDVEAMRVQLFYFGVLVLCVIVPFRAGSSVSSDTKVRGTNFLMLTPLSARRIVWGTWCSSALQVLLAALLALPLLYACRHFQAGVEGTLLDWQGFARDAAVLGLLTLCGWVAASLFMFTAGLARFFRIGLFLAVAISATSIFSAVQLVMKFSEQEETLRLLTEDPLVLPLLLVNGIAVFVLLLELTRRHYAAPAENCSASVRLLALLPMALYLGMALYDSHLSEAEENLTGLAQQGAFAVAYLLFALLSDALLPTYAMPVHSRRAWRWLPSVLQVPGIIPSTLCILLGTALCTLPLFIGNDSMPEDPVKRMDYLAANGLIYLNLAYTLLFWLLITDLLCRRDNRNRPVICGFVAIITFSIAQGLADRLVSEMCLPLAGLGDEIQRTWSPRIYYVEGLPGLGPAYIVGCLALAAATALLVAWRGRVHKG